MPHTAAMRQIKDLPGPRPLPLVGNAFQVKLMSVHQDLEHWARKFGPLYQMHMGRTRVLVIADHELFSAVLRDRPHGFRRSPRITEISHEMGLPQGLTSSEGDDWQRQRRMVMASFAPGQVRAYFPSLRKVTLRLQSRWQKAAQSQTSINLQADLMRFTVDAIAGLAFGKDINTLESGEDIIQRHLDKVLPTVFRRVVSLVPYWRYLRLPADRAVDQSIAVIKTSLHAFVSQARQRLHDDPALRTRPGNLLEAMIVAADEPASGLDDQQVTGNVLTMLLAGEDTTANTLAWMIHLLWLNPACLQQAQQEVRSLAPNPASFSMELMDQLVYLDACLSETMRLKPVAPLMALQALRDTTVGDVAVPNQTLVMGVLRHDALSENYFKNPGAFEPGRWLSDALQTLSPAARRAAIPFGSGPRICPGRYLALLEMKMAMAMLLSCFDIEAVDTPDGRIATERMSVTMAPVGLQMRLKISPNQQSRV